MNEVFSQLSWNPLEDFQGSNRSGSVSFSIGEKGYIGTGIQHSGGTSTTLNDFWEYNPALDEWQSKLPVPGAGRWDAVGFSIGSKGYVGTAMFLISQLLQATSTIFMSLTHPPIHGHSNKM